MNASVMKHTCHLSCVSTTTILSLTQSQCQRDYNTINMNNPLSMHQETYALCQYDNRLPLWYGLQLQTTINILVTAISTLPSASHYTISAFLTSTKVWLVELTPPTLPYLEVHYVTRSTTTRVFQPESDCGWANGWHVHSEMLAI